MTSTPVSDVIDAVVPLAPDQPTWALRRQREKVLAATQGSYDAMFSPAVEGLSVAERLFVALHACRVSKADSLAGHYRDRLVVEGADAAVIAQDNVYATWDDQVVDGPIPREPWDMKLDAIATPKEWLQCG